MKQFLVSLIWLISGCSQSVHGPQEIPNCKAEFPNICYNCGSLDELRKYEAELGSKEFRLNFQAYHLIFERLNVTPGPAEESRKRHGFSLLDHYYFFKRPDMENGLKCVVMYETEVNEPRSVDGAACRIYQQDPILDTLFKETPSASNSYDQIKCIYQTMREKIVARHPSPGEDLLPGNLELYPDFERQQDLIKTVWSSEDFGEHLMLAYPQPSIYYFPEDRHFGEKDMSIYYRYNCYQDRECKIE